MRTVSSLVIEYEDAANDAPATVRMEGSADGGQTWVEVFNSRPRKSDFLKLFKPATEETMRDFYAELPITIKVTGSYHDIGAFASDIGKLSRIVTLNNIVLTAGKDTLVMDAIAKTFRYLDDEEIASQRRATAKDKKGGK